MIWCEPGSSDRVMKWSISFLLHWFEDKTVNYCPAEFITEKCVKECSVSVGNGNFILDQKMAAPHHLLHHEKTADFHPTPGWTFSGHRSCENVLGKWVNKSQLLLIIYPHWFQIVKNWNDEGADRPDAAVKKVSLLSGQWLKKWQDWNLDCLNLFSPQVC